ncbi:MAG: AraC family transcriptional regulator [Lachnospiraceae bacterium]|nr:AraC family transcriptional regulator [Lachnospiraceae bacterium]
MSQCHYDITYHDFNPTVLFASKLRIEQDGVYHSHNDFTEIAYTLSGKGRYQVEGTVYDMQAGDLIICNPGVHHQNLVVNPKEPAVQFFIGFSNYQFRNMPPDTIQLKDGSHFLRLRFETRQEIAKHCYEILAENEAGQLGKYFMLKAHLMQILLLIVREIMEKKEPQQKGMSFETYNKSYAVKKIITYLNENYEQKISLDQIAHNMYLSPVYISKIFKDETGETPINYLIKIRLEKAKQILEYEQDSSIKSIANQVGYEDVYHFSKLFKKYYGVSPLLYKKTRGGTVGKGQEGDKP